MNGIDQEINIYWESYKSEDARLIGRSRSVGGSIRMKVGSFTSTVRGVCLFCYQQMDFRPHAYAAVWQGS